MIIIITVKKLLVVLLDRLKLCIHSLDCEDEEAPLESEIIISIYFLVLLR
jgi:hypothetical protein